MRRSKDSIVVFCGLLLVIGIGAWSFFRSEKKSSNENTASENASQEAVSDFQKISLESLKDIVLQKNTSDMAFLLDMRPTSLWSDEHIIGSKSLMLDEARQSLQPTDTEKTHEWIVVAPDMTSAGNFVALLRTRGIPDKNIRVFDGTYEMWKEKTGLIVQRADPSSPLDVTKVTLASPEEAKAKIGRGGTWFILDTRSPNLFASGHIAGATNIPFAEVEGKRQLIPSTTSILVYGEDDRESFAGGVLLFDLGFFNTTTLSAGFSDWKAKNLPVGR
jgi:rhodanese-related sulfurtransferase